MHASLERWLELSLAKGKVFGGMQKSGRPAADFRYGAHSTVVWSVWRHRGRDVRSSGQRVCFWCLSTAQCVWNYQIEIVNSCAYAAIIVRSKSKWLITFLISLFAFGCSLEKSVFKNEPTMAECSHKMTKKASNGFDESFACETVNWNGLILKRDLVITHQRRIHTIHHMDAIVLFSIFNVN